MYPFVRTGDKLFIQPAKVDELHIGDVVFYRRSKNFFVAHHLIQKINHTTMVTKGNNMDYCDEPVTVEKVLGKVVSIERNGRTINLETWLNEVVSRCCATLSPVSRWLRPMIRPG